MSRPAQERLSGDHKSLPDTRLIGLFLWSNRPGTDEVSRRSLCDQQFPEGMFEDLIPARSQESPHFENGVISRLFGLMWGERRVLRSHIEHGATSVSTIRSPEGALQDSSYESRRREMPTSSCILALEKMRG